MVVEDSPNILQHAGISKETLAKLGVKVKAVSTDKPVHVDHHERLDSLPSKEMESVKEGENSDEDDEEDMTSPLPSILKKPKPLKKEIMEESRVEISPGLFTKRPSKSSETVEKVQEEINLDLDQSPKLPSLKTVDLKHLLSEKIDNKKDEISGDTPEMPDFKTTEVRHWSTQKKYDQRPSLRPSKAINENQVLNREEDNAPTTPEMPSFQSQAGKLLSAKKMLRNNKENTEPEEEEKEEVTDDNNQQYFKQASSSVVDASSLCQTPELPECKTINLASLLQKSHGTFL